MDINDKGPYPKLPFPEPVKVEKVPVPVEAKKVLSSKSAPMDTATAKLHEMVEKVEVRSSRNREKFIKLTDFVLIAEKRVHRWQETRKC